MLKSAEPQVSVVVPTYNRARDLIRCLDSLVKQTYQEFEVLVCDDGSTDDTREVVSRYTDRLSLRYHRAENFGGGWARMWSEGVGGRILRAREWLRGEHDRMREALR